MVAGILEKSKRVRNPFFFDIRNAPKTFLRSRGLHPQRKRGHSGDALVQDPRQKEKQQRHTNAPAETACPSGAIGGAWPIEFCLFRASMSVPVPPPAGQSANPCCAAPLRFPASNRVEGRSPG